MTLLFDTANNQLRKSPLMRLEAVLDWSSLRDLLAPLDELAAARKGGPVGFEPVPMAAALLCGVWYSLGYEHLATAIRTRLDFQAFCGFDPMAPTPTASSLCRFRKRLDRLGLYERLLDEIDAQLQARGIRVKGPGGALLELKLKMRNTDER